MGYVRVFSAWLAHPFAQVVVRLRGWAVAALWQAESGGGTQSGFGRGAHLALVEPDEVGVLDLSHVVRREVGEAGSAAGILPDDGRRWREKERTDRSR